VVADEEIVRYQARLNIEATLKSARTKLSLKYIKHPYNFVNRYSIVHWRVPQYFNHVVVNLKDG